LVRIGASLDESLSGRVFDAIVRLPLRIGNRNEGIQPLRDLDSIRSFLSGLGPTALFDLPWMPIYLGICFAFHFLIGLAALGGAMVLVALTLLTEHLTRNPLRATTAFAVARNSLAERSKRNAEVLTAMGMTGHLAREWRKTNLDYMDNQRRSSDVAGALGAVSKAFRLMLQSAVLGLGGYLVIRQEATAGVIIAASILTARALAPIDLAIANWKGFVAARQSWERLKKLLATLPAHAPAAARPREEPDRGKRQRDATGRAACRHSGHQFHSEERQWTRYYRPERFRQVVLGSNVGRCLAAGARQGLLG
jgi:ATP-binding cassette subfamily C protein